MQRFDFSQASSVESAVSAVARDHTKFIAGGTTLVDLMKLNVETPDSLVDINSLPLTEVERSGDRGLKIGAMVRNSDLAHHAAVQGEYAVLSQALLSGASPQLRNMATTGGNLLQRTRCPYFRDVTYQCNKRKPGSGCAAIDGFHRIHAIMGTSKDCIATHPSDMAVAMTALEAQVHLSGPKGERSVALGGFYLLPGSTPNLETVILPGELITYVTIPAVPEGTRSYYLKRRDRASYEFALASAAIVVTLRGLKIARIRIALGGIGTKPWRSLEAEHVLEGHEANEKNFRSAADAALHGAKPLRDNAFKVELAKRTLSRALKVATRQAA